MSAAACEKAQIALGEHRYETPRRVCLRALSVTPAAGQAPLLYLLHEAYRQLADLPSLYETLQRCPGANPFALACMEAEDYHLAAGHEAYRTSRESKEGFTADEYAQKYRDLALNALHRAQILADTRQQQQALASVRARCKFDDPAVLRPPVEAVQLASANVQTGELRGTLTDANGLPLLEICLACGVGAKTLELSPGTLHYGEMGYTPRVSALDERRCITGFDGSFSLRNLPAGRVEYIAAILPDDPLGVRFLAHNLELASGALQQVNLTLCKTAPFHPESDNASGLPPDELFIADRIWKLAGSTRAVNPFYYDFPRQELTLPLPPDYHPILPGYAWLNTDRTRRSLSASWNSKSAATRLFCWRICRRAAASISASTTTRKDLHPPQTTPPCCSEETTR